MVMTGKSLARIASHHWLRHPDQMIFHSYLSSRPGTPSVCGEGKTFQSVREMDVPGERSQCCAKCCEALYGPIGYRPPSGTEEIT